MTKTQRYVIAVTGKDSNETLMLLDEEGNLTFPHEDKIDEAARSFVATVYGLWQYILEHGKLPEGSSLDVSG